MKKCSVGTEQVLSEHSKNVLTEQNVPSYPDSTIVIFRYVGVMDRETAHQTLLPYPISTFLVRCRGNPGSSSMHPGYAISLKTSETDIKHMKVLDNLNDDYFLSDHRMFKSVAELVSYHSQHSLNESFKGLNTTLRFPIKVSLIKPT